MSSRDKKADFSGVRSTVGSTSAGPGTGDTRRADFSAVRSSVDTTAKQAGAQSHTVVSGDTLSHIAQRLYGRAGAWKAIYDANRDQLDDPDKIQPGQVLRIPPDPD